jgi:3-deoxy-manno-octulosonate cytidylyltransferase (CMP-KDO synthetase)
MDKEMKVYGVIPARYGSTRFPGKPLHPILGKPLLQWVIEGAQSCSTIDEIIVATDDEKIMNLCRQLNVQSVMTSSDLPTGTDRVLSALKNKDLADDDIIINIQGDEPLISSQVLTPLVESMKKNLKASMATLGTEIKSLEEAQNENLVKLVTDKDGYAIYFSRFNIPFTRVKQRKTDGVNLAHIGIYGYRRKFLEEFCSQDPVPLEIYEGLEQLRALWLGAKILVVKTEYKTHGVDVPQDVLKVEEYLKKLR